MAQITARARAALLGALSARFNDLLATTAPAYGAQAFTIDFDSWPKSTNFFMGALDVGDLEGSTVYKLPLAMLYATQSANQNRQKPTDFSGVTRLNVDMVLSWRSGNAQQDFESLPDAVEDVMNTISNDLARQGGWVVGMQMDRGPVKPGQKNWVQVLRFSFLFEVHI